MIWTRKEILNVVRGEGLTNHQSLLCYDECNLSKFNGENDEEDEFNDIGAEIIDLVRDWWETQEILDM